MTDKEQKEFEVQIKALGSKIRKILDLEGKKQKRKVDLVKMMISDLMDDAFEIYPKEDPKI